MSAEAQALRHAGYGEVSTERTGSRNGYAERPWDTRAGSIELRVPKLRQGSYFPEWLLGRRRRCEQALISVIAKSYLAGVWTRLLERLCCAMGIDQISGEPGLRDGQSPGRAGRFLPQPSAGSRAIPLLLGRRAGLPRARGGRRSGSSTFL